MEVLRIIYGLNMIKKVSVLLVFFELLGCAMTAIFSDFMFAVLLHWWGNLSNINSCWF